MNLIVAYDIADPRRLQRVAKVMRDYGLRVQKSIYEVDVGPAELVSMHRRVEQELEPSEDGVKFYPLCGRCPALVFAFGLAMGLPDQEQTLVL